MVSISTIEQTAPCGCIMIYQYDNDLPLQDRILTGIAVNHYCSQHPDDGFRSPHQHRQLVNEELTRKDYLLSLALDNLTADLADTDPVTGSLVLKPNLTMNWSVSGTFPNRVLTAWFTGINLSNPKKNLLQRTADQYFGVGKVIVQ